jgi:hypothetical protein
LPSLFNFKISTMKTTHTFLVFLFILSSITTVSAQYGGNGYGNNGYGNNGYGGTGGYSHGGGIGSGMNQGGQPEKPKEVPVEETVALLIEQMKPALNLDELQAIAISNVLKESIRTQGVLLKQDFSNEDQMKNFKALSETTDRKINQFLSQEQKEKYLVFKEDRKNQKKTKEKSKSKKEKEKQE